MIKTKITLSIDRLNEIVENSKILYTDLITKHLFVSVILLLIWLIIALWIILLADRSDNPFRSSPIILPDVKIGTPEPREDGGLYNSLTKEIVYECHAGYPLMVHHRELSSSMLSLINERINYANFRLSQGRIDDREVTGLNRTNFRFSDPASVNSYMRGCLAQAMTAYEYPGVNSNYTSTFHLGPAALNRIRNTPDRDFISIHEDEFVNVCLLRAWPKLLVESPDAPSNNFVCIRERVIRSNRSNNLFNTGSTTSTGSSTRPGPSAPRGPNALSTGGPPNTGV